MPTLKKLEVKNFESHEDTILNFHPKVNVITGESDVGKSGLKRSLGWVCLNRPSGDKIRQHNTKKTEVNLDGVAKIRTATKHRYELNGATYKALRAQVPDPVREELNLTRVNFQGQHTPYFLINDSPGQVAKALNEVADLSLIDDSLKECKRRIKENKSQLIYLKELDKVKQKEIKDVEWGIEADKSLIELEDLIMSNTTKQLNILAIEDAISLCKSIEDEVNYYPLSFNDKKFIDKSIISIDTNQVDQLESAYTTANEWSTLVNSLPILGNYPDQIQAHLNVLSYIEINSYENVLMEVTACNKTLKEGEDINIALIEINSYENLSTEFNSLNADVNEVYSSKKAFSWATSIYKDEKRSFNKEMKRIGICPLCNSEIK